LKFLLSINYQNKFLNMNFFINPYKVILEISF
jgi:hypothetical protein